MKYLTLLFLAAIMLLVAFSCGEKITRPQETTFESATVYLDNISIWGLNPSSQLNEQMLTNGGMESWPSDTSTDGPPTNWTYDTDGFTASKEDTRVQDSIYSAMINWTSTDDQLMLSGYFPITPESVYTCSLYVYDDNDAGMVQFIFFWSNGDYYSGGYTSSAAEWTLYTFSAEAPISTDSLRLGISFQDAIEGLSDTSYIQLNPTWDISMEDSLSSIGKLIVGHDTYIYACDTGADRIVRLDAAGTINSTYDVPNPIGVAQDELLRLLVVNGTGDIYKIDVGPNGDGEPVVCFSGPSDTSVMKDDFIFTDISDGPGNDKVYYACGYRPLIDNTGQVYMFWNSTTIAENTDTLTDGADWSTIDSTLDPAVDYGTGAGYADHPNGITLFKMGSTTYMLMTQDSSTFKTQLLEWYVNEYYNVSYFQAAISPSGDNDLYADRYRNLVPTAATIDSSGNIYVVTKPDTSLTTESYSAFKFDQSGMFLEEWGEYGSNAEELNFPRGIAYDNFADRRTVYISDTGNNRILRFMLSTDLE